MRSSKPIRIAIADSQFLVVKSLGLLLRCLDEYEVVAEVDSYTNLAEICQRHSPNLLIIDYKSIGMASPHSLSGTIQGIVGLRVLHLMNRQTDAEINNLLSLGVKNIIYKTTCRDELLEAIAKTLCGSRFYSQEVADQLPKNKQSHSISSEKYYLTQNEIEVVKLIARGLNSKAIATHKGISYHTVMSHRKNIFRKLGINNASELVMWAARAGLVDSIEYYI